MIHGTAVKRLIQYFFLGLLTFLLIPQSFYHQPLEGLDTSWNIALHLAYKYHLQFGKDFVFTYGPLGILHSRHPIDVSPAVYLAFDMYLLASVFFAFKSLIKIKLNFFTAIFILLLTILTMYESLDIWIFALFLLNVFYFIKNPGVKWYIVQSIILTIISFYFKVSVGIVGLFILLVSILYLIIRKKIDFLQGFILLAIALLLIWGTGKILHVHLPGYLISSLQLINDYNDAMFRGFDPSRYIFIYAAISVIFVIGCWALYRVIVFLLRNTLMKNLDEVFIYAVTGLSLFILFKSGFVRGEDHFHIFFKGAAMIVGFIYLFQKTETTRRIAALCCWFVLGICYWSLEKVPGSDSPFQRTAKLSFLTHQIKAVGTYLEGIGKYHQAYEEAEALSHKDNELKRIIGNQSVDIISSEISKIYFNGLRYNPRPVIQSYAAYNTYLDSLNAAKYRSVNAPDYVLFNLSSIDQRFPFFDETRTKLVLMERYNVIGNVNGDIILKKKSNLIPGLVKSTEEQSVTVTFGQEVSIHPTDDLQFSRIIVQYSNWGKLRRLFFQPPKLSITFTLETGEERSFRAIKPIMEDGVILNKYVDNTQEFQFLLQSNGKLNTRVTRIRIGPDSIHSGFKDSIRIVNSFYNFAPKNRAEQVQDSLSLLTLMRQFSPLRLDTGNLRNEELKIGFQTFSAHSHIVEVEGWAFTEKASNKHVQVKAVLAFKDNFYELPTEKVARADLPPFFGRDDLDSCGFISRVSKLLLPPGHYQLGIMIVDPATGVKRIKFVPDHDVLISEPFQLEELKAAPSQIRSDSIQYYVSSIQEKNNTISIEGFSFIKSRDSRGTITNLIFIGQQKTYRVKADILRRPDVSSYFKNPQLDYSGFLVKIPKGAISPGTYSIAIEEICCNEQQRFLKITDNKLTVDAP